ncbi:hypothetical protein NDU88_001752 [Pleurodeles waltl]|uniref:Uncharacterized protein n=1 Tax=Pleurodeles waltl TaxID=8319 RepID=A0AAV7NL39_PLEWA|nr:hypothetical protein NDU88_001752 [Pleurodeles waltl]
MQPSAALGRGLYFPRGRRALMLRRAAGRVSPRSRGTAWKLIPNLELGHFGRVRREGHTYIRESFQDPYAPSGAMPNGKSSGKHSRKLLFSEAIARPKIMAALAAPSCPTALPADPHTIEATDRILQEITAVGRRLDAMDLKIADLCVASSSIWADIASFRETVTDLDQRLTTVEGHVAALPDQDAELRLLRAKVIDLEDRSRRDKVCFFGIPEHKEGSEITTFLKKLLPELTGLDFLPPLEFQRVHRIGPLHKATSGRPRPISACFLRHNQARQVISIAGSRGPYSLEGHEIRVAADFSKITNEKSKPFLALRPQLRNLDGQGAEYPPWVLRFATTKWGHEYLGITYSCTNTLLRTFALLQFQLSTDKRFRLLSS